MLSVTESSIRLVQPHVLSQFEKDVLTAALQVALVEWETKSDHGAESGDVHAEVVYRMQVLAVTDLLAAVDDKTVVFADTEIDLG